MQNIKASVFQDGADFYITDETDESGGAYTATAPFPVKDSDMDAAIAARKWFETEYAVKAKLSVTWEA